MTNGKSIFTRSGQALIEAIGYDIETVEDVKNNMENIKIYMRDHNLYEDIKRRSRNF